MDEPAGGERLILVWLGAGRRERALKGSINPVIWSLCDVGPGRSALNSPSAAHVNGVRKEVEGFGSTPMQWLEVKEVTLKR
jgi:hypothetical protein